MTDDPTFHYPPDLFNAVRQAVPLLTRARKEVPMFFQGCGVDRAYLAGIEQRMRDKDYGKYPATEDILRYLNEGRDTQFLRQRREVVKRIIEWEDFSSCYPDKRLEAQGAVATVRQLVNAKDSLTRMQQRHDDEMRKHRDARREELDAAAVKRKRLEDVRSDLFALFSETDAHKRGKQLEGVLNRLFQASGILVREAFTVQSSSGGVVDQIDGAVDLDGRLYLVEMKWWKDPLSGSDISPHLVDVYGRADAGGIFISTSGYHESAVEQATTALAQKTVVLVELEEIVRLLSDESPLDELLRAKIREATLTRRPLFRPLASA